MISAAHPTREKGDGRDGEGGDGEETGASEAGTAEDPQEPAGTHRDDLPVRLSHIHSLSIRFWRYVLSSVPETQGPRCTLDFRLVRQNFMQLLMYGDGQHNVLHAKAMFSISYMVYDKSISEREFSEDGWGG